MSSSDLKKMSKLGSMDIFRRAAKAITSANILDLKCNDIDV